MNGDVKRIGIILFEDADILDVAGPTGVFHCAGRYLVRTGAATEFPFCIDLLSLSGGLISTWQGVRMETKALRPLKSGDYDTIIIAGGDIDDSNCDPRLVEWLARNRRAIRRIGSVCTGAFVLAAANLLHGRRATTHWMDCDLLQSRFPTIDVDRDSIFVEDGGIWTSAGITAGIDMALAMVEEDHGRELALLVARNLVVFLKRPGGQAQFSTSLQSQSVEGPLAPLLHWITENPGGDLRAEALADRAHMSLRNFYRSFELATGTSPALWIEDVRLQIAKRLLEQTDLHIDQVAVRAGFVTYERMRRAFGRRMGVTPAAYRARFTRPASTESAEVDLALLADAGSVHSFQ